jgi:hypothetical protein
MVCLRSKETRDQLNDMLHSINAKVNRALHCIDSNSNLSLEDLNDIRILTAKIELTDKKTGCSQLIDSE